MITIKAPNPLPHEFGYRIFLAGSIEMGKADNWHSRVEKALKKKDGFILNPRRDYWDSSWEQKIDNAQFFEQVTWELDALDAADIILMYFDPTTQSPISLLELGLYASTRRMVVCCPEGFWRKGNVDIVCRRFGVKQVNTLEELVKSAL